MIISKLMQPCTRHCKNPNQSLALLMMEILHLSWCLRHHTGLSAFHPTADIHNNSTGHYTFTSGSLTGRYFFWYSWSTEFCLRTVIK